MARRKEEKPIGATYLVSGKDKNDNPKLKARVLEDGRKSLYLEYYLGRDASGKVQIKKKSLKLFILPVVGSVVERSKIKADNANTMALAIAQRKEKEAEMRQRQGLPVFEVECADYLTWMESYYQGYNKADKRVIKSAIGKFRAFLASKDNPEYNRFDGFLPPSGFTRVMCEDFSDWLGHQCKGEGANSVWKRFAKMARRAAQIGALANNPCEGVRCKSDEDAIKKAILSPDEIRRLALTTYPRQSPDVRRAFLFSLQTGLRFCDVSALTFGSVDYENRCLVVNQSKTKKDVVIPLSDGALSLIGKPVAIGEAAKACKVFDLPSHAACVKALRTWCAKAGVNKHITWHCARHSFATAVLEGGASVTTTQNLLGHSDLRMTQKYLRAIDQNKRKAVESVSINVPEIEGEVNNVTAVG